MSHADIHVLGKGLTAPNDRHVATLVSSLVWQEHLQVARSWRHGDTDAVMWSTTSGPVSIQLWYTDALAHLRLSIVALIFHCYWPH